MRKTTIRTQGHIALVCSGCRAPAVQRIVRRSRRFCLLGHEVLPLGRAHVLHCTLCGCAAPLANREADTLVRSLREAGPMTVDINLSHVPIDIS